MKIVALSDTHLAGEIPDEILCIIHDADIVVHAGDFNSMEAYDAINRASKKLIAVHGNSDSRTLMELLPEVERFEVDGIRFGIIHKGREYMDTTNMRYLALEMGVDVLIYGHLHRPIIEKTDVLLVCPGSPTYPRMADPTMVELSIEKGNVTGRFIKLAGGVTCDYINYMRSLQK